MKKTSIIKKILGVAIISLVVLVIANYTSTIIGTPDKMFSGIYNPIHTDPDKNTIAPQYHFTGDTDTGIGWVADDELGFYTGGTNRITIDDSGNIGIGVTSLSKFFHLVGGSEMYTNSQGAWNSDLVFQSHAGNAYNIGIYNEDNSFRIAADNGNIDSLVRFLIDSTGKVGIGTITPASSLDVDGGIRTDQLTADPCGGATYPEGTIFYNTTSDYYCFCDGAGVDKKVSDNGACF